MPSPDDIVRAFVQTWNAPKPEPDEISNYFAENAVYHNIPLEPIIGRAAIHQHFAESLHKLDGIHWEIHHQVASGNMVLNERTDTLHYSGGRATPVRIMGIFEITDGLITAWRDYFDMAEANRAQPQ